jgi:hypothetical protein
MAVTTLLQNVVNSSGTADCFDVAGLVSYACHHQFAFIAVANCCSYKIPILLTVLANSRFSRYILLLVFCFFVYTGLLSYLVLNLLKLYFRC